jgi:hypothetical protein
MKSKFTVRPAVLAFVASLAAGAAMPALAQSSSPAQTLLDGKFVFNLGAFLVGTDVNARLNGQSVTNPDINFDDTFGKGHDATRWRADALWRITPTQHLRFMYFDNRATNSRVLAQDVKFGDYTFQAGSNVSAETKFNIAELAYEYAFMRGPSYEVAGTLGVHYMDLGLKLAGQATVTDGQGNVSELAFSTKSSSVAAPLPVIGLRAGWVVAPQWYVEAQGQFFKANVSGIDGYVTDLRLGANWMFNPNWGVGLGYNRFVVGADVNKNSFDGHLRLGYGGLQLYLTGAF